MLLREQTQVELLYNKIRDFRLLDSFFSCTAYRALCTLILFTLSCLCVCNADIFCEVSESMLWDQTQYIKLQDQNLKKNKTKKLTNLNCFLFITQSYHVASEVSEYSASFSCLVGFSFSLSCGLHKTSSHFAKATKCFCFQFRQNRKAKPNRPNQNKPN